MTTLADLIFSATRRFSYRIAVNGVELKPSNQATGLNLLTGVPGVLSFGWDQSNARIDVNRAPSWMRAGMPVTIDAGFNGLMMRVWSGDVVAMPGEDPDYLRDKVIVRGATIQVGTPPDDVPVELTAEATLIGADVQPPLPSGTHIEHEISVPLVWDSTRLSQIAVRELGRYGVVPRRPNGEPNRQSILCGGQLQRAARAYQLDAIDLSGMTDQDGIELICDLVGITKRSLIEPTEGWYTLDVGAQVGRGRPLDMLATLMIIGGLEAYHTEDGTVIFRAVEFAPGPSHAWSYDVQDQALARVISATGELEVTFNPFVRKYSTGLLNIPFLNYNSERVFARNVRHEVGPGGERTYIDAWGGSRLGGTVAINPIAAFTFKVEREVIGDGVYLVYTCDASASFDPDGTSVTYAWTCNRTTTPASLPSTKVITFRVPSSVATPLTLTLTVTDADALTHAVAVDLPTAADDVEMQIPAIYAALKVAMSATPDGGGNWSDIASLSGDETSVDAKPADGVNAGIACYGYTDGTIKRTTDFAVTSTTVLAADAANGTINEVWWDKNVQTRVWACTSTGRLLRSDDDGLTWVVHKDFGGTYPLHRIATPQPGGVWVFGGKGDDTTTLMQYEAVVGSGLWQSVAVGGDLATALVGAGSALHVRSSASRMAGELIILLNGTVPAGSQDNIFYTANVFDPTGAGWTAATGLTAGLTDGREIVPDEAQGTFRAFFGNRSVWNTTDGIAFVETTNVLPAGFTPNRVLWLGDYTGHAGTYLIAAEDAGFTGAIYKWLASEATADELRPATGYATWPASAAGKGIAIGAANMTTITPGAGLVTAMTKSTSPRTNTTLSPSTGIWSALVGAITTGSNPRIFPLTPTNWFVCDANGGSPGYSKDAGATWTAIAAFTGSAYWFARTANGRIIALTYATVRTRLYYSDDEGDTWALLYDTGANTFQAWMVACDPTDADKIVICDAQTNTGIVATRVSTDGGASFTQYTGGGHPKEGQTGVRQFFGIQWLPSGRIIVSGIYSGTGATSLKVMYSDDLGATWTTAYTESFNSTLGVWRGLGASAVGTKLVVWSEARPGGGNPNVGKPLVSINGGASFAIISPSQTLQDYVGVAAAQSRGMAYDPVTDALYVSTDQAGFAVVKLSPVDASGIWTNVTNAIGSTSFGEANLAAVPAS